MRQEQKCAAPDELEYLYFTVEQKLETQLAELTAAAEPLLCAAMHYAVMGGGKRIRSLLALSASALIGATPERALPVACAVEYIHSASLILDDLPCMDNGQMRRGRETHHRKFGADITVLTAMSLLNAAFAQLLEYAKPGGAPDLQLAVRLIHMLNNAIGFSGLIGGQLNDLHPVPSAGSWETIGRLQEKKTAELFCFAAEAGALVAGATIVQLQMMRSYAKHLGLAYQAYDDLVDHESNSLVAGKDTGVDRDKQTFVNLFGHAPSHHAVASLIEFALSQIEPFGPAKLLLAEIPRIMLTGRQTIERPNTQTAAH